MTYGGGGTIFKSESTWQIPLWYVENWRVENFGYECIGMDPENGLLELKNQDFSFKNAIKGEWIFSWIILKLFERNFSMGNFHAKINFHVLKN